MLGIRIPEPWDTVSLGPFWGSFLGCFVICLWGHVLVCFWTVFGSFVGMCCFVLICFASVLLRFVFAVLGFALL